MRLAALLLIVACTGDGSPQPTGDTGGATELYDPLSMPAQPTLDLGDVMSASECQECHPDHVAEWHRSMHAYAMADPVFQALTERRQADLAGTEDRFCVQCHSAFGTRAGSITAGFAFDALPDIVMEGITCESCHKVTEVARTYNSGHVLDPTGPMRGPEIGASSSSAHEIEADPLFATSEFCGGCHDVLESSGLDLERPYREWLESPSADAGETCQDCHMPRVERPVAVGSPSRTGSRHQFVGVDLPLIDGWLTPDEEATLVSDIQALLDQSAALRLSAVSEAPLGSTVDVTVTVENRIPAHNLPTGSTFLRQVWLELVARDGEGHVLYVTGDLDANGDLRDYWSALDPFGDHDLVTLSSNLVDRRGTPTLFPWIATEHTTRALSPLYERTVTLFVPTTEAADLEVNIEARLRFRPLAPYLLRALDLEALVPKVRTYDIAADTLSIRLTDTSASP